MVQISSSGCEVGLLKSGIGCVYRQNTPYDDFENPSPVN